GSIHRRAHHQAATASLALGEFAEAVSFCKAALEIKPDYLDALISVGHANLALNQLDEAEKEFKRFLEIAANYSEHTETNTLIIIHLNSRDNALYNLGKIQEARERWSEALKHYAQAQRLSEPYLDCHARLGWCEYRLGSYESAQKHFKAQIEADPKLDSAHMGLAGLAIDAAQADRAEAILRNGISLASDTRLLSGRLAELLIKHGRTEEGLAITEQALTSYPEFGPLLAVRGNALNALGRFEEAVESFQRSEELKSGMAMTALGLANALLSLERNQEAVTWFKLALGRDPYSALARRNLAIALIRVGELVASEEHLRSYLEVATDDRQARFILAALLFELNRPLESVAIYETLLREDPSDQEALLALSDCYAATGSIDSAGAGYRRLLQMNPAHPLAAERLSILSGAGGS
ncbi:MAG: tetratricopeptide repeat protein, partial [Candidatus Zixiibacteriota bacterium]